MQERARGGILAAKLLTAGKQIETGYNYLSIMSRNRLVTPGACACRTHKSSLLACDTFDKGFASTLVVLLDLMIPQEPLCNAQEVYNACARGSLEGSAFFGTRFAGAVVYPYETHDEALA